MSIASRITSIEGHISDIYDSVELTGVDTTDIDKNLVNVPNTLKEGYIDIINNGTDTLYNNFPKVSGEGTSLTLNNTYQAPMRNLPKGNTSQTGTPTPTSPIDVNVVSGDNSIHITTSNYFNAYGIPSTTNIVVSNEGATITMPIATSGNGYTAVSKPFKELCPDLKVGDVVYLYFERNLSSTNNMLIYFQTPGITWNVGSSKTLTQAMLDSIIALYGNRYTSGETGQCILSNFRIVKNTTDTFMPFSSDTYPINLPVENLVDTLATNTSITGSGLSYTRYTDGSVRINGTTNRAYDYTLTTTYTFKAGETYTFNWEVEETSNINPVIYILFNSNNGGELDLTKSARTITRTITENQTLAVKWSQGANKVVDFTFKVQVEKGSKASPYTPYGSAIELCKIGTYQDQFKKATGKNLAPINLESETYNTLEITNNNNGTFTLLGNPTGSFGRDIATNLTLEAGTYTISANEMPSGLYIALDNEADTQLSNGTLSKTFTLASDTTYTSLGIWFTKNKNYDVTIKLQIEEGSSASEWQPYGVGEWYLHKEIGKVVFTGSESENWTLQNAEVGQFKIYINNITNKALFSNYFGYKLSYSSTGKPYLRPIDGNLYAEIGTDLLTQISVSDFKTWLSTHNTDVYYPLATPTSEGIPTNLINQIEQFYQAQSKNNQTNISQINNDLGFIISASALKKGV